MKNLTYTTVGDYNIPNLILPPEEDYFIGKYGRMRERYLEKHRRVIYINLLTSCKLQHHLYEIDVQCNGMIEKIVEKLTFENNVTEQLKYTDQMKWIELMNAFKALAEEVVCREIIYL